MSKDRQIMVEVMKTESYQNAYRNGVRKGDAIMGVNETRNYGQFRFSEANRPIDVKHLARLKEAIATKNLLAHYYILVTPQMVVIDGQHRLKAAESLNVPIYYKVVSDMSVADISHINEISKSWTFHDYLNYWCAMGNQDYVKIAEYSKKNQDISLAFMAQYLSTNVGGKSWSANFKEGNATARRLENFAQIVIRAREFEPHLPRHWKTRSFLYAVQTISSVPEYDHKAMMNRISSQNRLVPCVSTLDYLALLTEIYNYRVQFENRLDFVKAHRALKSGRAIAGDSDE